MTETVQKFLTDPTPTLTPANTLNPAFHPGESAVAGSPYPMPAQVKARLWDNAQGAMPNPVHSVLGAPRNRNSV